MNTFVMQSSTGPYSYERNEFECTEQLISALLKRHLDVRVMGEMDS